jgi:L-arabinokinase
MYRLAQGATQNLADVEAFIKTLDALDRNPAAALHSLFEANKELFVARAPGRLDVMGGIADYSGSLMLELPTAEATLVALQRTDDRYLRIASVTPDADSSILYFEMPLADFEQNGSPVSYQQAREYFQSPPEDHWAAYVAGAFLVLMREQRITFSAGARILISSAVPLGKGVSSSAALEVSVMQSIVAAFNLAIKPRELALLCQKVENLVAGAPCGVMDQLSVLFGEANRLLALICQPAELRGTLPIPDTIAFWGIDSGVRHSVAGADYGSVRVGAFMGYRIIADVSGLSVSQSDGVVRIADSRWQGYLANVTPAEFADLYESQLPDSISGSDFLERYGGTTDSVTQVNLQQTYQVKVPAAHAVYENDRVRRFGELLKQVEDERTLALLGELMYQSHASYSACGLGSGGTDRLVELVRAAGPVAGLFGARITGGGSGGTVAVLGRRDAWPEIEKISAQYARERNYQPYIFQGSSPGAEAFGCLRLAPAN